MGLLSGSDPIVAYDIDLGMHLVLCHGPCDELQEIYYGDRLAWSGSAADEQITVAAPGLFGDEGGLSGKVDVLMGTSTQTQNDYLQARLGTDIPAFRGVMALVFRQTYWGRSAYLKKISATVKRTTTRTDGSTWYAAKADINGDMNPAHIIHECLTNASWGLGYPISALDDTVFQNVADYLYGEQLGLSIEWSGEEPIEDFIQRIEQHIDGKVYVHPSTGLFTIKLIRDGYSLSGLFIADETNVQSVELFERRGWGDAVNELTVIYRDRDTNQDTPVTMQDIGNAQVQGRVVSETRQYPGLSSSALAQRICKRDLRALSAGLAHAKLIVDRKGWEGTPGDPFKFSWAKYGINQAVFRVVNIDTGTLTDGRIIVDIIEDVYGLPNTTYLGQPETGWTSPHTAPAAVTYQQTREGTYWEVHQYAHPGDIPEWGADFGFAVMHVAKNASDALSYQVWSRVGTDPYAYQTKSKFCPTATMSSAVGYGATALTGDVWNVANADYFGGVDTPSYAWIDNELVAITAHAITGGSGTITVDRGVLDTVPAPHNSGARIWFADEHLGIDDDLHQSGETVDLKALPTTSLGTLDISSASALQQGMNHRYHRPYPPGNVKINTERYPTVIEGALALSWSHRDRTQQLDSFHTQTESDIGPEAGTTYTVRVYGELDTLVHTETGVIGTSWTYDLDTEGGESGLTGGEGSGVDIETLIEGYSPTMYLRFGEASGTTATDEMSNHDGTYTGGPTLGQEGLVAGDADTCVLIGNDKYVEIANHADFQVQKLGAACLADITSVSGTKILFHFGNDGVSSNQGYKFYLSAATIVFNTFSGGAWHTAQTGSVVTTGKHQFAVNVDTTAGSPYVDIYMDGALVESFSFPYSLGSSTYGFHWGAELVSSSVTDELNGRLDEGVFLSGAVLTPTQIADMYAASIPEGRINGNLRVELESLRDGLTSIQNHNIPCDRAGYGLQYGNYYGGAP